MSSIYDSLNPAQQEAVRSTEGPVLILAGAGSGKTRVLIHRIAYLIQECEVKPWHIFAITFTNKAAREMRERVDKLLGSGAEDVWVSTFHSACVRILRRYSDRIGYERNFTIYDTDDQKTVVKEVIKKLGLDPKLFRERAVLSAISSAKNKMRDSGWIRSAEPESPYWQKVADIFDGYQKRLKENNAMDFDDLLLKTVELFEKEPEALNYYQDRFQYIMVDEYQDTNAVQFRMVSLLAQKYRNLCVVGDDDQSIYKFRGADIRNILDFENVFPDAKVIRLEENYRSTKTILNAANGVIHHNAARKDKTLWTENDEGVPIKFRIYPTEHDEARAIVRDIARKKTRGGSYSDFAILYRTNAQARILEEQFVYSGVPYRVFGGVNFYQRKEIKDALAYLKTVDSGLDDLSVERILNVPRRGIGTTSIGKVEDYAAQWNMNFFEALRFADEIPGLNRAAKKMDAFVAMIDSLRTLQQSESLTELYDDILDTSGYLDMLKDEGSDEAQTRRDNLDALRNKIVEYERSADEPNLTDLLAEIALVADIDNLDETEDRVALMTLHSAKGLEFPNVYIAGMEDGIFPSYMSLNSDEEKGTDEGVEEERRLCYVGITRAEQTLTLTAARQRMVHGNFEMNKVSRFIDEIPRELIDFGGSAVSSRGENSSFGAKRRFGDEWQDSSYSASYGRSSGTAAAKKRRKKAAFSTYKKVSEMTKTKPDYEVGDRVKHVKFGEGVVQEIKETDKDYQVTVEFDRVGVKKMLAGFAKLKKI